MITAPSCVWRVLGVVAIVVASIVVDMLRLTKWWLVIPVVATTAPVVAARVRFAREQRALRRVRELEPQDEWIVELDGVDVGLLTASRVTDMFWKVFFVVGSNPRLFDEQLWLQCRFRFRHAKSGRRAEHAFCGGLRPTVDEPWVSMRGLY